MLLYSVQIQKACDNCKGSGIVEMNLAFMESIKSTCNVCEGKNLKRSFRI